MMSFLKTCSVAGVLMLSVGFGSSLAAAAENDKELQISLGAFKSAGADSGSISGEVTYGKYVSSNWLLGVIQGVNYAFINDADDVWTASTVGFANYHFGGKEVEVGEFVPFAGVFIGATYNEDDSTGTLGPNFGGKYFVNEKTFISARYRYEWFFDDLELNSAGDISDSVDTVSDNSSDGNHVLTIGLGFRF